MKESVVNVSIVKVNIIGTIFSIIIMALSMFLHVAINGDLLFTITFSGFILFLIGFIGFVVLHEFIHLLGFKMFGGVQWDEMKCGFNAKLLVAYAHTKKAIPVPAMKKSLLLPFIPTGVLPLLVGLSFNLPAVTLLSSILISGCIGDFMLYHKIRSFPNDATVIDHPTKPQFTVFH
ncbi:DUF3267 domain-containing protein [Bacillus sp. FJAT-47783]|uniref:DUF3267 domain-containing protein n=1 Tax=Bacillus sp. FJAT-47783 TaxID=2922712 RepID=UPI001FABD237|nr:DUF3267 domain-containing protein [Bacillus sp. FJAT-47783]